MTTTKTINPIKGKTFIFTGTLTEFTRAEAESMVKENGGSILSGVTDKLNYLVVGEDAGSKLEKAKKIKTIKILKEKEFLKLIPSSKSSAPKKKPAEKKIPAVTKTTVSKTKSTVDFKSVKIGKQEWMTENLNVDKFRNGDQIPEAKTDKEWMEAGNKKLPAWCYYDNKLANGKKYGKLYNWYAVNDPRGLSPEGWHVPSEEDFKILAKYLGKKAAKKIKDPQKWPNKDVSNESGFSIIPSGFCTQYGAFGGLWQRTFLWSSTEEYNDSAIVLTVGDELDEVIFDSSFCSRANVVRCIRN
jgi:uncharacterized protein (TIGR02145 family)